MVKNDPRQLQAVANYKNPESETFGNLFQSMLKAGFSKTYCNSIYDRNPSWLSLNVVNDVEAIKKAEENIIKYNNYNVDLENLNNKFQADILKVQLDASKFVLKTLAKSKYGDNEEEKPSNFQINIVNYHDTKPQKAQDAEIVD